MPAAKGEQAILDVLAEVQADVMLPGHGPVWRGSMAEAAQRAQAATAKP